MSEADVLGRIELVRGNDLAMTAEKVQRFYRFHACLYDATRWLFLRGRRRAVERLDLRPDSAVLELGCGTGLNFAHIVSRLDARTGRLAGVDFSEPMLRRARRRVAARGWPNVGLLQEDAGIVAIPGRFDAVLFAYSLAMMRDWQGALRNAAAHLSPGGRLVVLEFGRFDRWGPAGAGVRRWLRWHHVETRRPYVDALRGLFADVRTEHHLGGYYFIACARNRA